MIVGAARRGRPIMRLTKEWGGHGVPPLQSSSRVRLGLREAFDLFERSFVLFEFLTGFSAEQLRPLKWILQQDRSARPLAPPVNSWVDGLRRVDKWSI